MFLEEIKQSLGFCPEHARGFLHMTGNGLLFNEEHSESLFLLISIPPALLGRGKVLLCSNCSEHRRAIKTPLNKCYFLFDTGSMAT